MPASTPYKPNLLIAIPSSLLSSLTESPDILVLNPRYRPECLRLTTATGDLHFASEPGKCVILLVEISLAWCLSRRLDSWNL